MDTNRRDFIAGLMAAIAVCPAGVASADTGISATPIESQLGSLASLSADQLYQLHKDVYSQEARIRTILIDQLVSETTPPESRLYAAYFLGAFRFKEAASALAEYITLEDKNPARRNHDTDALWLWGKYPAMA
jgi:hypothetical protein